jgi:hypothetical protein
MTREATVTSTPPSPARHVRRLAIVALVLAVVGGAVGYFGFVSGIDYALNSSGGGPGPSIIIFLAGAAVVLLSVVLAVVGLLRNGAKVLSTIALVIGLLPIAVLVVVVLSNRR